MNEKYYKIFSLLLEVKVLDRELNKILFNFSLSLCMSTVLINGFSTWYKLNLKEIVEALFLQIAPCISLKIRYHDYYNDIHVLINELESFYFTYI